MGYEILSSDILDDGEDIKKKPRVKRQNRTSQNNEDTSNSSWFKPIYLHIAIILIILAVAVYFLMTTFSSNSDMDSNEVLTLIGNVDNFKYNFSNNFTITSQQFTIESKNGNFDDLSKEINIENFKGSSQVINKSIIFIGTAKSISYGKNKINLDNSEFKLISNKKTQFNVVLNNITLQMSDSIAKLDGVLNYEFENSSIQVNNFNSTIVYDGVFSFSGLVDEFLINSPENHLEIKYKK